MIFLGFECLIMGTSCILLFKDAKYAFFSETPPILRGIIATPEKSGDFSAHKIFLWVIMKS